MLIDNLCPPARWLCCMIVLHHSSESDVPVASYSHSLFMIELSGNVCSSCASPSCKQSMKLLATIIVATNGGAVWDTECWFLLQPCLARIRARLIWVLGEALPCSFAISLQVYYHSISSKNVSAKSYWRAKRCEWQNAVPKSLVYANCPLATGDVATSQ
jgi:hypothetical protein